jgi:hypothetical protein
MRLLRRVGQIGSIMIETPESGKSDFNEEFICNQQAWIMSDACD